MHDVAFNERATSSTYLPCQVEEEEYLPRSESSPLHANADVEGVLEVGENLVPHSFKLGCSDMK